MAVKLNTVIILGELTTLNKYVDAERTNRYRAADIKKRETDTCTWFFKGKPKAAKPTQIFFVWYVKDQRKDPDNVAYAKKFILDGMVQAGVLENDGMKHVNAFRDDFLIDKDVPRVEVHYA